MRIFDVSDCRAEILRPSMNLMAWTAKNKPFAVCNASLYNMRTRIPIGTVIENGQLVHNDGNGYGCGITTGKTELEFGKPWDGHPWEDYLTGYPAPVQGGAYVPPGFNDSYVFGCRLARIGIGRKGDRTFIVTDDNATLREFADHAIAQGFDTLVNLDGGGSRHLYYDSKAYYTSQRIPYNAVAFFKDEPMCEYCTFDGRCSKWTSSIKA